MSVKLKPFNILNKEEKYKKWKYNRLFLINY